MELRPLGFGEIFDRAITLYVRNFLPFAGIVSVVIVPLAVLQYFVDRSSVPQFDEMIRIFEHPKSAPPTPIMPAFMSSPGAALAFGALILVVWAIWPFALNACAVGIARLYRGLPVEFRPCYRAALRHWGSVLVLLLVEGFVLLAWYVAFVVSVSIMAVLTALVARASVPAGVALGILALAVLVAGLLVLAPLFVTLTFAMNGIVIEERGVFDALGTAFARVFSRREFWRAVLFALAAGAVLMGASTLTSVVAMLAMFAHLIALEVIVTSVFRAAIAPFSIVLLAIYYFDVRIRREGYDIEAGLDRLTGVSTVA